MVDINNIISNLKEDGPANPPKTSRVGSILANLNNEPGNEPPAQEPLNPGIQDRLSSAMAAVDVPDGFSVNASQPEFSYPSLEEFATELVTPADQRQYQNPQDMIEPNRPSWEYSAPVQTGFKPEQLEKLIPLSLLAKENTGGELQQAIARLSDNDLYNNMTVSTGEIDGIYSPTFSPGAPRYKRRPLNDKERGEQMAQDIKLVQEYFDNPRQYSDMVTHGFTPEQIQQWELAGEIGAVEGVGNMTGRDWLEKVPLAGMVFSLKHSGELMSAVNRLSDPNRYDEMTVNSGRHENTGYNPYYAGGRMSVPVKRKMTEDEQLAQMEKDIDLISEYLEKRAELEVRGRSLGNDVLQGILEMPDFMATFMVSGPAGAVVKKGVGKAVLNAAVKKLGKRAVVKLLKKKGIQAGLRVAGSMLDAGGRMVVQAPEIIANAINDNTDSGEYNLTERGLEILNDRENMSKSLTHAIGDMYIENFSEVSGYGLSKVGGKITGKIGDFFEGLPGGKTGRKFLQELEEFYKSKNPDGDFGKLMRDKMKFGGFIEEYSEEVWGDFLRGVFNVEDFGAGEDANMNDRMAGYFRQQAETRHILTTAGVLGTVGGVRHTANLLQNRYRNRLDDKAVDESLERRENLSGHVYQGMSETESDYQIYENAGHMNNAKVTRDNNTARIMAPLEKRIKMRDMGMGLKKGTITTRSKKTALGVAQMYNTAYDDADATIRQLGNGRWLVTVRRSPKISQNEGRGVAKEIDVTGNLIPLDLQPVEYSSEKDDIINPERGPKQFDVGRTGQDIINSSQPDSQVAASTSADIGAEGQYKNQQLDTDTGDFDNQQSQTAAIYDDVNIVKYPGLDKEDIPLEDQFIMSADTSDWDMLGDLGLELEDITEGADQKIIDRAEAIYMQPVKKQPPKRDITIFQAGSNADGKALEGQEQVVEELPESFESNSYEPPKSNHIGDTPLTEKQISNLQERVNKQKKLMWAKLDKSGRPYLTSKRPKKEPFLEFQPHKPGEKKSKKGNSASPQAAVQQQVTEDYMNRLANEVHTGNISQEQAERSAKTWGKANIDGEDSGLEALEQAVERASESEETDPVATEIKDIEDKLWQFDMQDHQTDGQREIIRELNDRLRELKQQQNGNNDNGTSGSPAKLPDTPDNSGDGVDDQKRNKVSAKKVKAEEKQEPENNTHIKYDPKLHRLTGKVREDDYYGDYAEAEVIAGPDEGKTIEIPVSTYEKEIKTVNTMLERLRQNTVNIADGQVEAIIEQAKKQGRELNLRDVTPYVPGVSLRHIEDGAVSKEITQGDYDNLRKTFAAFDQLDEFEKTGIKPYMPTTAGGWQITDIAEGDKVRIYGSNTRKTVKKVDHGGTTVVIGNDHYMGIDDIIEVDGKKPSGKKLSDKYPTYNNNLNEGDIYIHSRHGKPGYFLRGDTLHKVNDKRYDTEAEAIKARTKYLKDNGIEQTETIKGKNPAAFNGGDYVADVNSGTIYKVGKTKSNGVADMEVVLARPEKTASGILYTDEQMKQNYSPGTIRPFNAHNNPRFREITEDEKKKINPPVSKPVIKSKTEYGYGTFDSELSDDHTGGYYKYQPGQTMKTASGRRTKPVPKIDTSTRQKATNSQKRINTWLQSEAILEAKKRGDSLNERIYADEDPKKFPPATLDMIQDYIFNPDNGSQSGKVDIFKDPNRKPQERTEPWQFTKAEYMKHITVKGDKIYFMGKELTDMMRKALKKDAENLHRHLVRDAVEDGYTLPPDVAREYDDYANLEQYRDVDQMSYEDIMAEKKEVCHKIDNYSNVITADQRRELEGLKQRFAVLATERGKRERGNDNKQTGLDLGYESGKVMKTRMGRTTKPVPSDKTQIEQWLISEAELEAKKRGDDLNIDYWQKKYANGLPADKIKDYLFHDISESPEVSQHNYGEGRSASQEVIFKGGAIRWEEDRIRVYFDDKPSAEVRKQLKGRGFALKWSPKNKAWQTHFMQQHRYDRIVTYLDTILDRVEVSIPETEASEIVPQEENGSKTSDRPLKGVWYETRDGIFPGQLVRNITNDNHLMIVDGEVGDSQVTVRPIDGTEMNEYPIQVDKLEPLYDNIADKAYNDKAAAAYKQLIGFDDAKVELGQHWVELKGVTKLDNPRFVQDLIGVTMATNRGDTVWAYSTSQEPQVSAYLKRRDAVEGAFRELVRMYKEDSTETVIPVQSMTRQQLEKELTESEKRIRELEAEEETPANLREYQTLETRIRSIDSEISEQIQDGRSIPKLENRPETIALIDDLLTNDFAEIELANGWKISSIGKIDGADRFRLKGPEFKHEKMLKRMKITTRPIHGMDMFLLPSGEFALRKKVQELIAKYKLPDSDKSEQDKPVVKDNLITDRAEYKDFTVGTFFKLNDRYGNTVGPVRQSDGSVEVEYHGYNNITAFISSDDITPLFDPTTNDAVLASYMNLISHQKASLGGIEVRIEESDTSKGAYRAVGTKNGNETRISMFSNPADKEGIEPTVLKGYHWLVKEYAESRQKKPEAATGTIDVSKANTDDLRKFMFDAGLSEESQRESGIEHTLSDEAAKKFKEKAKRLSDLVNKRMNSNPMVDPEIWGAVVDLTVTGLELGIYKFGDMVRHLKNEVGDKVTQFVARNLEKAWDKLAMSDTSGLVQKRDGETVDEILENQKPQSKPEYTGFKIEKGNLESFIGSLYGRFDNILESDNDFPASAFFKMADQYFGGSRADGVYGPSEAYDVLEVAINRYILDKSLVDKLPAGQSPAIASEQVDKLGNIVKKLMVSQTNRSGEKATMQQFSTPPHYAAAAGWVANISENDRVLEPSAGTGCLCLVPISANATVQANELSDRRGELLQQLSDNIEVTGENAEYIQHLVSEENRPDVVLMNPPFSRSAAKAGGKKKALGTDIKHIEAALDTLKPGGRLVAIMGAGLHGTSASFTRWMLKIKGIYSVRANVTLDRSVYKKYGTEFPTRMLVIDKVNPTGHNIVSGEYATPSEMMMALDEVRNDRVETTEPTATVATGKQTGRKSDATPASKSSGTSGMATGSRRSSSDKSGRVVSKPKLSSSTDSRERGDAGPTNADGTVSGLRGDAGEFSGDQSTSGRKDSAGNDADISESNRRKSSQSTTGKSSGQSDGVVSGVAGTQITDSIFEPYIPVEIFPGAKDHPATLVESAAMAAVPSPPITYTPEISKNVINDGGLSAAQIEAIARAGQAHKNLLPNGDRMGFMVGDGTGVGKGREISGIIVDNWNRGRKKAIWISKNKKLYQDAVRDLTDLGFNSELIHNLLKIKYNQDISEQIGDGVLFTTYNTVKSSSKNAPEHTRLGQIQQWIGEPETFDGVIALDEAHIANNVLGKGIGGPSKVAETIRELQELMPNARIVYVSATGASEVESLAYMERLGMWGKDTQFADVHDFINNIASGGVAAMEVVAQELKARGLYMARSIAYNDGTEDGTVQYDRLEHELDDRQKIIYDEIAKAWQMVLTDIWKSMGDTGAVRNSNARAFVSGQFWSANQRFFNTLITSMQIPSVIRSIESDMKEGRSAVLQITQTGQAAQERALARMEKGQDLEDFDSSPIHVLTDLVMNIYPVHLYEDIEDENGKVRSEQVKDSNGDPVVDQKAVARRDALMGRLTSIRVPASPLETIIDHFGVDNVAEVTGRTERVVYVEDDNSQMVRTVQRRPASANEAETAAFQTGQKRILIFSEAGGTGASYHADRRAENQQKRHHYLVDAGWKADAAMQGLGRCHRSNQVSAPWITLASTNLSGHKRFISTIARRLSQLGALTRGQAKASGNELFSASDNLESPEAKQAVIQLCTDIARGAIDDISGNEFLEKTGLKFIDEMGSLNESNIPESTQFLNRLLSLEFDYQNMVFSHFAEKLEEKIQQAIVNGTLDTGVENIIADRIEKVQQAVLEKYDDGGQTGYVQFTSYSRNEPKHLDEILRSERIVKWVRLANDKVVGLSEAGNVTNASGQVVKRYRIITPVSRSQIEPVSEIDGNPDIVEVDKGKLNTLWADEVANTPEFKEESIHMVTGRLLPIWKQLKGQPQIRRLIDDKNEIYLGRKIPQKHAKVLLESVNITMKARKMPVKDIVDGLKSGGKLKLANGWTIRQRMTGKEKRYLLDGPDFTYDSTLNEMGIFSETVGYKQMYFIPAKDIGKTAQKLIKQYKLEEFEGVEDFQKPLSVEYLHESADLSYVNTYLENSELSPKRLAKAFGIPQKSISTTDTDGEFIVNLPNGKTVYIDSLATINKDGRDDYRGLWRNLPGTITLEDGRKVDFDGMIRLSAYFATADSLPHEQFHAAMDLALSDREKAVILSRFNGDEEWAADIYGAWAAGRDSKGYPFFTKIRDFFRRIFNAITDRQDIGDIFSRIYSGKIWNGSAQAPAVSRIAHQKPKGRDLKTMVGKGPEGVTNRKVKQLGATWGKEHKTTPQERIQIRTDARRDYEGKKSARQLAKENTKTAMGKAGSGINYITNILEPNRAATKSFGYDTVAEIIKMAAAPEAGQLEFGNTILSNIELSYRDLRDKIEKLSPEQKQYIYHIRGEAVSDAGKYLQTIAQDKISKEALEYAKMLDEVYNSAYDLLKKHNFEAMYFDDYFYGVYKDSYKGREITNKFLKHYPTTEKMLKHKAIPTVADANGLGLEMRDQNPVDNAFREVGAIWRLAAMVQLRDYLVKSHTETGIVHVTDANEYHLQNWRTLYKQRGSDVEEPIFQSYLIHPDLYRPIAALNSFNLTGYDGIRQVRSFIHIMNGFKFLFPMHHCRTIAAQHIVDSGSSLGMFKPSTWKKLTKYKIDDEIMKSKEYLEYVSLGGGHNSSMEIESRQAMKKWIEGELRWHNALLKIPYKVTRATTGKFTDWTFEKYIPGIKYAKYLQEVDAQREKQGTEPTDAQKIEIIKIGQNFYGEMNEKIFGRSATVTSAMRFAFLAPGFREGNYRTMLRAFDAAIPGKYGNKLGGPLGRDWRSFRNIPLFLTLSMLAAQMASLILTGEGPEPPEEGENPEEWLRDLFKVRTGQKDNKGRPIMLDLMTSDKDYYEQLVSPFIKTITGRPDDGLYKFGSTLAHTFGGMTSSFRSMVNDVDTVLQGKVLVDWKGERVWYESDSGATKFGKFLMKQLSNYEPIPSSTERQMRDRGLGAMERFLYTGFAMRVSHSEIEKRRSSLWRKFFDMRDKRTELQKMAKENELSQHEIDKFNDLLDDAMTVKAIPVDLLDYMEGLYLPNLPDLLSSIDDYDLGLLKKKVRAMYLAGKMSRAINLIHEYNRKHPGKSISLGQIIRKNKRGA